MKKYLCMLLCLAMLITVLPSCQNKDKEAAESGEPAAETTDTGESAPSDPETKETESAIDSDSESEEPEEPEELPDAPSVLYYTEYTDRLNRVGQSYELCALNPDNFTVKTTEDKDGNITKETVSYSTSSWYIDVVISDLIDLLMEYYELETKAEAVEILCTENLKIYTAIDPTAQSIVEDYFEDSSNFTTASGVEQPEASMVITDPATGDILALVGGRGAKEYDEYNFATEMPRQPGSALKPLSVYAPALDKGIITYSTVYEDSPYTGQWPANYPAGYRGPTQIHDAVCRSVNTVAVKVLMDLGAGNSIRFLQDKLAVSTLEPDLNKTYNDRNASALGLGGLTYGITNRELTAGYQIFTNKGQFSDARTVVLVSDRNGEPIIDNKGAPTIAISEESASIMTMMLEEVVDNGTADDITLNDRIAVAGKTGTTDDMKDKWFVGYTPYYIGGVWFGYATPKNLDAFLRDQSPATKIWQDVMTELHEAKVFTDENYQKDFEYSDGMITEKTCSVSGQKASESCPRPTDGYFTAETAPTEYCTMH